MENRLTHKDIGVKMTENVENGSGNAQENSEKSENIQQNSEINPENESGNTDADENKASEGEKSSGDDGELEIPEPDIIEDEGKKKKEPPEWLKKKLERDRKAAEHKSQEAARLKEENERLKAAFQPPQQQQQAPQNPNMPVDPYMPQRQQFPDDASYFLALSDYRDNRRHAEAQFHARQAAIQQHEQEFQGGLKDAIESGKTKYKDFEERTDYILYGDGFPSNRAMAEAIVESKYKDDILYFLGTHIKEAERIANLNPVAAAKEIAKIEVRFDSRKKSNIPKAPKPLAPLGGNSQGSGSHKNPENMEMDEFRQWYKDKFG